jgi:DNA replication protein DnaC
MATIAQAINQARNPGNRGQTLPPTTAPQIVPLQSSSTACEHCGDTGLRHPNIGETFEFISSIDGSSVLMSATEATYRHFSMPCEYCVQKRRDKVRAEFQSISGLTDEEMRYRLDGIVTQGRGDTAAMLDACREMVHQRASMLTFWGTSGNAKTLALIATVNEFLDRGIPAIYLPSYDMLNWIQDAYSDKGDIKSESAYARLERCKGVRMLAVDELQGIKITDWRLEQLRNLIDRRWRDGLEGHSFTLFAMNEDPELLEPRIFSRLRDGRNRLNGSPILLNEDTDMRPLLRKKA